MACLRSARLSVSSGINIPLKAHKETFLWVGAEHNTNMSNPAQSFVVNCEVIRRKNNLLRDTPLWLSPRHSHSIHAPMRNATLLPEVYKSVAAPSLSRSSSSKAYNRINLRPTIIYGALTGSYKKFCLLLNAIYLSDTKAAISKCKA